MSSDPAVLREVEALAAGDGRFKLIGGAPFDAELRFSAGELVECDIEKLPDGSTALVARHSVSNDPEFRKRRATFGVCGALFGMAAGAWLAQTLFSSPLAALAGALIGAPLFAYCSIRWGDDAWFLAIRLFRDD